MADSGDSFDLSALTWEVAASPEVKPKASAVSEVTNTSPKLSKVFEQYRKKQLLDGVGEKTLDDKRSVMNLLIRIIGDLGVATTNEVATVKKKEDIQFDGRLLKKYGSIDYQDIWELGINAALRISDLLSLKYTDVLSTKILTLTESKTEKTLRIKLNVRLSLSFK
ncbi:MAG: hypothetical protein OFPI_03280 [Osedax symbiont Rs2]|nr:MAG: hypothetical protein OFPI_03280 [Osedax symbiont Rs2]